MSSDTLLSNLFSTRAMYRNSLTLSALFSLVLGCEAVDYDVAPNQFVGDPEIPHSEEITIDFDLSIDVAFQRSNFGGEISRCQFQVALFWTWQNDGFGEGGEEGQNIEWPTQAGECAITTFPEGQPDGGAWQVRGSVDAGDEIFLYGDNGNLSLARFMDESGRIFYDLDLCDQGAFPFSDTFDLDAPYAVMGDGMGELYLEEVIGVGPKLTMTSPTEIDTVGGRYYHQVDHPLPLLWEHEGDIPEAKGHPLRAEETVMVRNTLAGEHNPIEAFACLPSTTGSLTIGSEWWQQLTPNSTMDSEEYYTALQIDARYFTPETETPWGSLVRAMATVTDGGVVYLYE
jgi:hypothetical protein